LASHFVPLPVSTTIVFPAARTSSAFARMRMRFFSSGGDFFSQSGFGTTPNIAPPSSPKAPPSKYLTSTSPKCMHLLRRWGLQPLKFQIPVAAAHSTVLEGAPPLLYKGGLLRSNASQPLLFPAPFAFRF